MVRSDMKVDKVAFKFMIKKCTISVRIILVQQWFNIYEFQNKIYLKKNHIPACALGLEYGRLKFDQIKGKGRGVRGWSKVRLKS